MGKSTIFIWVPFDLSAKTLVQATELSETPRQILVLDGGWRESGARPELGDEDQQQQVKTRLARIVPSGELT